MTDDQDVIDTIQLLKISTVLTDSYIAFIEVYPINLTGESIFDENDWNA